MANYPKYSFWWVVLKGTGWLYAIPMGVGTVFLVLALTLSLSAFRLETQGEEAPGVITSLKAESRSCGKNRRNTCTDHWVSYRYTTALGEVRLNRESVSEDWFKRLNVGDSVPVRYVEGQPDLSEIELGTVRSESWIVVFIAGGLWIAIAVFGSRHLRDCRRGVWLRDFGNLRQTVVTEVKQANVKINDRPLYRIAWSNPPGEGWARGKSNLPEVGTEICVFDHPEGKWPSVWEGDVGSRNSWDPGAA